MKNLLFTLITVCFLLIGNSVVFSQTTKKKLVKCTEKGKIVYRTKCKAKKTQPVADIALPTERYGDPSSKYEIASDGPGTGMGQGRGTGGGMGSGTGQGTGSGTGVGQGSGNGVNEVPPPKSVNTNGTVGLKILSKPRRGYTDEARANQIQGTVILRVTFLANGTIGAISVISGLPDGLTQQAIDAAKLMKFEPARKNGKPYTVIKQVQYSFTLY